MSKIVIPPFLKTVKYRHVLNEEELTELAQRINEILARKARIWNHTARTVQYHKESDMFSTAFSLPEMPLQDIVNFLRNHKAMLSTHCRKTPSKGTYRSFDTELIDERVTNFLFEAMKGRLIIEVTANHPEQELTKLLKTSATNLRRKRLH